MLYSIDVSRINARNGSVFSPGLGLRGVGTEQRLPEPARKLLCWDRFSPLRMIVLT